MLPGVLAYVLRVEAYRRMTTCHSTFNRRPGLSVCEICSGEKGAGRALRRFTNDGKWRLARSYVAFDRSSPEYLLRSLTDAFWFVRIRILSISTATENAMAK